MVTFGVGVGVAAAAAAPAVVNFNSSSVHAVLKSIDEYYRARSGLDKRRDIKNSWAKHSGHDTVRIAKKGFASPSRMFSIAVCCILQPHFGLTLPPIFIDFLYVALNPTF